MNVSRKTLIALAVVVTLSVVVDRIGRIDSNFPISLSAQPLRVTPASASSSGVVMSHSSDAAPKSALALAVGLAAVGIVLTAAYRKSRLLQASQPSSSMELTALTEAMIGLPAVTEAPMTLLATRGGLVLATWEPLPTVGSRGLPLADLSEMTRRTDASSYVNHVG